MIENWQLPLLMTFLAGLATIVGGFITFFVNKNNMKVLSLGLGFSAGVMIFVSLTEIMHSAQDLLKSYFPNNYAWMVFAGFIAGVIISKLIDTFVPGNMFVSPFSIMRTFLSICLMITSICLSEISIP